MKIYLGSVVRRSTSHILRASAFFLVLIALISLTGCVGEQRKQAQDLVKDGSATSDRLAKYYDTLAQQRADHLSLTIFELKRAGGSPLQDDLKKAYKDQQEALAARAELARKLKNVYDSLGKLIDYDAPSEVTGAVNDLKEAIEKAADKKLALPGLAGIDPKAVLDKAIKALVDWYQIREFRRNAPKAQVVLDSIYELFDAEKALYLQISQDYNAITFTTVRHLYRQDQLTGISFFQPYVELYGLQVYQAPTTDPVIKDYVIDQLTEKRAEFDRASEKQRDGQLAALRKLKKTHEDFMLKRKPEKAKANTARRGNESFDLVTPDSTVRSTA